MARDAATDNGLYCLLWIIQILFALDYSNKLRPLKYTVYMYAQVRSSKGGY